MKYMSSDIDRIEKNYILRIMNNILSTGDDKTFKRILDLGWVHMLKTRFETMEDDSNLV